MQFKSSTVNRTVIASLLILFYMPWPLKAEDQTVGLFLIDSTSSPGYNLFSPRQSTSTFLIDGYGRLVNTWESDFLSSSAVYLLENGHILRGARLSGSSDSGSMFQKMAWDGTLIWDFKNSSQGYRQHHDIEPMPNGNVLVLAWEFKTDSQAFAAGRDPALLTDSLFRPTMILEFEKTGFSTGDLVWEWRLYDHLIQDFDSTKENYGVVADHPELLDINFVDFTSRDWIHANSVAYNAALDQIMISSRNLDEFWIIDHSTTTAEAASHTGGNSGMGGDIIYRWGNPQVYDAGTTGDQKLFGQHDAHWIETGYSGESNILLFNNGLTRSYSSVDELVPPVDSTGQYPQPAPGIPHGPADPIWVYTADPLNSFYAFSMSGARRLSNGNTFICSAPFGEFFEVTSAGEMVWRYINPFGLTGPVMQGETPAANNVFRCHRYAPDHPGLAGQDLTPDAPIEGYIVTISGTAHSPTEPTPQDSVVVTTTISSDSVITVTELNVDTGTGFFQITLFDDGNHHDGLAGDSLYGAVVPPQPESKLVSYYIYAEELSASSTNDPPNPPSTVYSYSIVVDCGDVNGDGNGPNVADLTYLVDYLFRGGPPPPVLGAANVNGNNGVNVADLTYLVDYLFRGGPAPVC